MKYPLRQLTIAVTGDFGRVRTHEKLKQWIEKNGGKFVRTISEDVTHLICSKEDYKDGAPLGTFCAARLMQASNICGSAQSETHILHSNCQLRLARGLADASKT